MLIRWYISSKRLLTINIACNFIPHKKVLIDDKDPLWINKEIKTNLKN